MKVVLFCGGRGTRMRSDLPGGDIPKPMQLVGPRPLLWHVMRYYAHFGHRDFILCLGYGAQHIKSFFLNYQETASNDFVLRNGRVDLLSTDISDWSVSLVDTGVDAPIGSGFAGYAPTLRAMRSFWRTTRMCSPTRRCPTSSSGSAPRTPARR
ncbi:hypothetical protein GCM10027612_15800 [Microbispora bryophytorum subsp. camponoti]